MNIEMTDEQKTPNIVKTPYADTTASVEEVTESHKHWGGARKGAGRKLTSAEKKLPMTICVTPTTRARMKALRAKGVDVTSIYEETVENLARALGLDI